jgi:hypothetical protein
VIGIAFECDSALEKGDDARHEKAIGEGVADICSEGDEVESNVELEAKTRAVDQEGHAEPKGGTYCERESRGRRG